MGGTVQWAKEEDSTLEEESTRDSSGQSGQGGKEREDEAEAKDDIEKNCGAFHWATWCGKH